MKWNRKGFTLVELLGVFAILGIIMLVAIPNVMGVLDKNKKNTYVQHAKQMVALAEYKMSSDPSLPKPTSTQILVLTLGCLDASDIETGPEGNAYDLNQSFVAIWNNGGYQYSVTIRENTKNGATGIALINSTSLSKENAISHVGKLNTTYSLNVNGLLSGISGRRISYVCS